LATAAPGAGRRRLTAVTILFACLLGLGPGIAAVHAETPSRLTDREFWRLVIEFSESDGYFRSDNLLSNELWFQQVIPELVRTAKPGRVYLGVGPEQNFTYIAALRPSMAFIIDVRRGNLHLQLMYKALFEVSADRAEFVSRLFSKKRPDGLNERSTVVDIFAAYRKLEASDALYAENLKAIKNQLVSKHGFALTPEDLAGIEYVYRAFFRFGPTLQYSSTGGFGGGFQPSYGELMIATDTSGEMRGYLASEDAFEVLKSLQARNLVVPVIGNFGGPKAIRAVGAYLQRMRASVSAFYLSNVEQYLRQDVLWEAFCANVATLPLDETSTFIRSVRGGGGGYGVGLNTEIGAMATEVERCR
jgi:hypothetical protein